MNHTFKFFHGREIAILRVWAPEGDGREFYTNMQVDPPIRPLRTIWTPQRHEDELANRNLDVVSELTMVMSEEITRSVDNDIVERISRRINGGSNHGIDYLNHWLRMGDNRA